MASDSADRGTLCTLEFAVQMTCQSCVDMVRKSLQGVAGVQGVEVHLENQMVLVQTTLPSQEVQALLEGTGRQAVLKGMGGSQLHNLGVAVAILGGSGTVQGVVRFLQLTPERCLIEGTIDGLEPGLHGLHVHQYGDLTQNCNSCGDHFNPDGASHGGPQDSDRHRGDLGNVRANADGRAIFRIEDEQLKAGLWHHRTLCWPFPESQTDLHLRWPHHLGGARPAHCWQGPKRVITNPCPPLSVASPQLLSF
ncbi:copper chaperone for superoxide dismutase isoform X2 [Otolemur garnettii]|uniref:copper chaperone for superoxide dismutase isoform X2 n=1 Tax=Otolemur garnettii TaxID=30611 RepID=UPI000C7F1763|nr:copper chaperone for superoxide dismutase isoform X2 [Otolemur garnettii]